MLSPRMSSQVLGEPVPWTVTFPNTAQPPPLSWVRRDGSRGGGWPFTSPRARRPGPPLPRARAGLVKKSGEPWLIACCLLSSSCQKQEDIFL